MDALKPEEFLNQLVAAREAFWKKMNAERKSYGAEKPLSAAVVLRRLQVGVVMERKAAEVTAPWVGQIPDLDLQQPMSEYVVNELKHTSILRKRISDRFRSVLGISAAITLVEPMTITRSEGKAVRVVDKRKI